MITENDIPDLPDNKSVYVLKAAGEYDGKNDVEYLMSDGTLQIGFWHSPDKSVLIKDLSTGDYEFIGIGYRHRHRWRL